MATARLEAGQLAPRLVLPDHTGAVVSLADYRGQKLIVYFYPEADTPACNEQACGFNDGLGQLTAAGFAVLGISKNSVDELARFAEKFGLRFPLLSDPDLVVHRRYRTWGEKLHYGQPYTGTLRTTFVLDEKGRITHAFYNAKAKGHLEMLRKRLRF